MPARLHHIVAGAHDLPGPARFWTQTVKNRVHHDLTSSAQDRDQEIGQLLALGTRRRHRADRRRVLDRPGRPERNEPCAIRPKETLTRQGSAPAGADRPCPRQKSKFFAYPRQVNCTMLGRSNLNLALPPKGLIRQANWRDL